MAKVPRYKVKPVEGSVKRTLAEFKDKRVHYKETEEEGYFMVYFPRGHSLRMNERELRRLGFHRRPTFIGVTANKDRLELDDEEIIDVPADSETTDELNLETVVASNTRKRASKVMEDEGAA